MAFGLSPRHALELPLEEFTPEAFLVMATEAAEMLGWNIGPQSPSGFVAYTRFSFSSYSEEVKVEIQGNRVLLKSTCTGNQLTDWGKNKRNLNDLISTFGSLKNSYSEEDIERKYRVLQESFPSDEAAHLPASPLTTKDKLTDFLSIFRPVEGYFVTPIIIILNLAVFVGMVSTGVHFMIPESEDLVKWGANFRPVTMEGEWWRLLTCCFLHIGVLHLLMNLYALLHIGLLVEPYLGKTRFLAAYLLSGITASLTSLYWHEFTVSAGASGAIFGMYGVFLAMLTTNLIEKAARKTMLTSISIFVGYNLLNGLKGGIDNAAHIGGLISGLVIGYAFFPSLIKPKALNLKYATVGMLMVLVTCTSFVVFSRIPRDMGQYTEKMNKFQSLESMALEVYQLPEGTPKEELLSELKNRGIYYWNENLKVLAEIDSLDLPSELTLRNAKLKTYCQLRIKSYALLCKAVEEDTQAYESQIGAYDEQIEDLIADLSGKERE